MPETASAQPTKRHVRYPKDLPPCCKTTPLALPVSHPVYRIRGGSDTEAWEVGLDMWHLDVGLHLGGEWDLDHALADAVIDHLCPDGDTDDLPEDFVERTLADHGLASDASGTTWVGTQLLYIARFHNYLARDAGREVIGGPSSLAYAADALASDLIRLVNPLLAHEDAHAYGQEDEDDLTGYPWSQEIVDRYPETEFCESVLLLRHVTVHPLARGHRLGAWAAAHSIAQFADGNTLIATMAAPLTPEDGAPGYDGKDHRNLTDTEHTQWDAAQARLATYWATHLGLAPLTEHPHILVGCTAYTNDALTDTLATWRH